MNIMSNMYQLGGVLICTILICTNKKAGVLSGFNNHYWNKYLKLINNISMYYFTHVTQYKYRCTRPHTHESIMA